MVLELDTLFVGNYLTAFPISVLDNVSLCDAVGFMARRGIGNLIVSTNEGDPLGILTERDLVFNILNNKVHLDESIELYSLFPLITAKDGILANEAASIMALHHIKRLALTDNGKLRE